MKVVSEISIIEVDGKEELILGTEKLIVESHWNRNGYNGLIVLKLPNGKTITVSSKQLTKAIECCTGLTS